MNVTPKRSFRSFTHALIAFTLLQAVNAEDEKIPELTTTSGKTYQNVRVTKVTPSEVSITHESGAARIPFGDLPEDLKAKLGYDPAKAEAHKQAIAKVTAEAQRKNAKAAKQAATLKAASSISGRVDYIVNGVAIIHAAESNYRPVVSSSQSNGGGGGYYAPGASSAPTKPPRPKIYGTYAVTNVPDISTLADNDSIKWLVSPTNTTQQIGANTYKVCQYVGPDK